MKSLTSETETQDYAYGPQHCRQLAAGQGTSGGQLSGTKLLPKWALINADTYAWFANVSTPIYPSLRGNESARVV